MTTRVARLKEGWLLRGWTDVPCCFFNWKSGEYHPLGVDAFYVARSCDARTAFVFPAFLPKHIAWLNHFIESAIAEECDIGAPLSSAAEYRLANNTFVRGVQWAVTGRCNLRCRHCYMEAPSGRPPELSFDDLMLLVERFVEANIGAVSLTGGEPFLRKDLLELVRLLTEAKIRVADIYTNGTLVTDRILDELNTAEVQPVFRISFDGCGVHDQMRGVPGTEAVVVDAIRRIRAAGFAVVATTCVDRTNVDSLLNTYEQMKKLDVKAWGVGRPQPVGCGRAMKTGLSLAETAAVCTPLLLRWVEDGRPFQIGLEAFFSTGESGQDAISPTHEIVADGYACASCRRWPYVAPDAKLMPCISYGDTEYQAQLPSLLANSFAEAWNDAHLRALLDIAKRDVIARNRECAVCELLDICGTGCRSSALLSEGDLLGKDTFACQLWKGGFKEQFAALVSACEGGKPLE